MNKFYEDIAAIMARGCKNNLEKEKRAAHGGISSEDGGQISLDGFNMPDADYTIKSFRAQPGTIAFVLRRGRENALTTREIVEITGVRARDVTERICFERRSGAPILSGPVGFWLAEDADEVRRCVAALHERAGEIHKTARALAQIVEGRDHV